MEKKSSNRRNFLRPMPAVAIVTVGKTFVQNESKKLIIPVKRNEDKLCNPVT